MFGSFNFLTYYNIEISFKANSIQKYIMLLHNKFWYTIVKMILEKKKNLFNDMWLQNIIYGFHDLTYCQFAVWVMEK